MPTDEQFQRYGYRVPAAPEDGWRSFDEQDPEPGYFQFDWLSARHPDLYHKFALSMVGLMNELAKLVDLSGLIVADIGAGTGRATLAAARRARQVIAIDAYESVVEYGSRLVAEANLTNVRYVLGDRAALPLEDDSIDAVICAWAELDYAEAWRALKPGGWLVHLMGAPGSLCGELTPILAGSYPDLITEVVPAEQWDPACPPTDAIIGDERWNGVPFARGVRVHDFTYVADYGDPDEAAAILGRIYGPLASQYMRDRAQSTLAWRLRIYYGQVSK